MLQSSDKLSRAMHGSKHHKGWRHGRSDECYATWDDREYYERMAEIREALSPSDNWSYKREFQ